MNRNDACLCGSGKKYKKCCMGQMRDIFGYIFMNMENIPSLEYMLMEQDGKFFIKLAFPSDDRTQMEKRVERINATNSSEAISEYSKPERSIWALGNHLMEWYGLERETILEAIKDIGIEQDLKTIVEYEYKNYLGEISKFKVKKY